MIKRRPELLDAPTWVLADAIRWARFPVDLDTMTIRLQTPPTASRLAKAEKPINRATLNWQVSNQSALRYATNDTQCTEPVSIRVIVYTKQRHKRIEEVYAKIHKLVARYAVTSDHLIQQATFEQRTDKEHPRIVLTITKKGNK